ncbi:MAG: helix-turn-helix domain-containing protein [bacterium]
MWKTSNTRTIVTDFIKDLGYSEEAARLYCVLSEKGALTVLEASREASLERTGVYRMVEKLVVDGLLERVLAFKSQKIAAVGIEQIQRIFEQKKKRVSQMENAITDFAGAIAGMTHGKDTQVRYFRGSEGIRQILWNETKAMGKAVGYTHRNLEEVVGISYFREYARELERKNIDFRDLRTDSFLQSTKTDEYEPNPIMTGSWRYLPDGILHLTHNMDVYNDVVAIYYWQDGDVFGIEIQNKQIAETQRSIFEALWVMAKDYSIPKNFEMPKDMKNFAHFKGKDF